MKIVEIILVNFKASNLLIGVQVYSRIHFLKFLSVIVPNDFPQYELGINHLSPIYFSDQCFSEWSAEILLNDRVRLLLENCFEKT